MTNCIASAFHWTYNTNIFTLSQVLSTSSSTSNAPNSADQQALPQPSTSSSTTKALTWSPDEVLKLKQLLTAANSTPTLQVPTSTGPLRVENHPTLTPSPAWQTVTRRRPSHKKTQTFTHDISEDFPPLNTQSSNRAGARSHASTSTAQQAPANPRSSTTPSAMRTFTLWQVSNLSGLTDTEDSAASSLMSIRTSLLAKHSFDSWMDILIPLQSREASSMLAGLASSLRPTSHSGSRSMTHNSDGSDEEGSTASTKLEAPTTASQTSSSEEETPILLNRRHRRATAKRTRAYFMDEQAQCSSSSQTNDEPSTDSSNNSQEDSTLEMDD